MHNAPSWLPPALPAVRSTRLSGRKRSLVLVLWASLLALYVGLFLLGAPVAFGNALRVNDATRDALIARGVSPNLPAFYFITLDSVTLLAFAAIAILMVMRRPDDWMVMLSSLTLVGTAILYTSPASDAPVPVWLVAVAVALIEILQVSFVYLFPVGQFIPRWLGWLILPMFVWRPVVWGLVYMPDYVASVHTAENYGTLRQDSLDTALMLGLFAIGIGAQVFRYRRVYNRMQQLQTKWVLWGILIAGVSAGMYIVVVNALGLFLDGGANEIFLRMVSRTLRQVALFMVPLTLAFSILRYRLWDIDLLVRRTLIYVPLTAILAGLFATLVSLSRVAVSLTGQNSLWGSMVATMVVAFAVEPVKNALQNIVDRRFKDAPDPHRQLENFGERVRQRLSAVRTRQIMRRFADEAIAAFQADGGAAYLARENEFAVVHRRGGDSIAEFVRVEVRAHGKPVGGIMLGERCDRRPYSNQDRTSLANTAALIGTALEQDTTA